METLKDMEKPKDIGERMATMEERFVAFERTLNAVAAGVEKGQQHDEVLCTFARVGTWFIRWVLTPFVPLMMLVLYLMDKGYI